MYIEHELGQRFATSFAGTYLINAIQTRLVHEIARDTELSAQDKTALFAWARQLVADLQDGKLPGIEGIYSV